MKMTRLFVLTVLSIAILSLAGCGAGGQQSGAPPEGNGAETSAEAPKGATRVAKMPPALIQSRLVQAPEAKISASRPLRASGSTCRRSGAR